MGIIDLKNFSFYDIFSSIFISLLSGTIFWSLGPTIIDRSLSVNILGTLYLAREPLSMEDINWSLYENYMNGKFQTKKRIEEQLFLGNIKVIDDDKFILTKKGFKAAQANIWITRYFNLILLAHLQRDHLLIMIFKFYIIFNYLEIKIMPRQQKIIPNMLTILRLSFRNKIANRVLNIMLIVANSGYPKESGFKDKPFFKKK